MIRNLRSRLTFVIIIMLLVAALPMTLTFAADTGFFNANQTITNNSVQNPDRGWTSNNQYATFDRVTDFAEYGFADLGIPADAIIDGIEVTIEGFSQFSNDRELNAALWNISASNPDAYTTAKTADLTTSDTTWTLGGPTDKWGKNWTVADFTDATFRIRIGVPDLAYDNAYLDAVQIKVYYKQPTITTVSTSGTPSTYGTAVTFTAIVNRLAATGNVNFYSGATLLGSGTLSTVSGVRQATYTTTATQLSAILSPHSITAVYVGDSAYTSSTSTALSQVVNQKALTATGIIANNKVYDGSTSATLNTDSAALAGVVGGDLITLNTDSAIGTFSNANVGTAKTVTISGLAISGTGTGNYSLAQPTTTANITTKPLTVTANADSKTFDSVVYNGGNGVSYTGFVVGEDKNNLGGTLAYSGDSQGAINAGSYLITPGGLTSTNYFISFVAGTLTITPAASSTTVTCPTSATYTGSALEPCTVEVTGAGGLNLTPDPIYADNIVVGTATASYTYPGDANHSGSTGSDTFDITPASSTTTVTCPTSEVYTGSALEPCTVEVTGAGGLNLTPDPIYADNIVVGTATASYAYPGDANHSGSTGSDTFDITPAASSTTVTCPTSATYTGSALEPCTVEVTGAGGLNLTPDPIYADNIVVGTATASYTYPGDANHSGSTGSDTFDITPASSTTTVTCPTSEVYTGSALEPCTVEVTGAGGLNLTPDPIYTDNIVVGTATASYTYPGDANHSGSTGSDTFDITPAASSTTVTCPTSATYTGSALEPCTVEVTGAGGLNLTPDPIYADNIVVGTATASYTYPGDANHSGSTGSDTFDITPASSTTTVTCPTSEVYTGSALEPCTVEVTGAGGLNLTPDPIYADNIVVGTATASYAYPGDANHSGSTGSDTFDITPAASSTTVTCPTSATYTGSALEPCTVEVTGAGGLNLTPDPIYADNIVVGTATASYAYPGDANHSGSTGSDTFDITPAASSTTVTCPTSATYTGSALEPCTVEVTGAGGLNLTPDPIYADNIVVGTATASYAYPGDANHSGSTGSDTFDITPAASSTTVTCPTSATYTGSALEPCTVEVTGAGGLNLTPDPIYTDNIVVGTATASYAYPGDANHSGSTGSDTFDITPAASSTTVTCPTSATYTGSALEPCTVEVTGAGGLNLTPDPVYTDNIVVGTATASYTYPGDANHSGSNGSDTFDITPKNLTVTGITADDKPYDGNTTATLSTTSATLVGAVLNDVVTLDTSSAIGTFSNANVGTGKMVIISGLTLIGADSGNYTLTQPTTTASITEATLTVDGITAANKPYDGNTTAALNTSGAALVGIVPGDDVTLNNSSAVGTFADPNVGTWTVTISGLALTGADADKYGLTQPTTTATITSRPITVTANSGQSKVYGAADPVFSYTHDPLVGSDTFSGALGRVAGENVGPYAITQGNLSANSNYSIAFVPADFSIRQATPSISLTSSLNPAVVGTSVTFTATVTPASATGTVRFYADNVVIGSAVTLSSGTASISITTLSAGTHAIIAVYSGNSNFNTSTSASLEQTVGAAVDDSHKTYLPLVVR